MGAGGLSLPGPSQRVLWMANLPFWNALGPLLLKTSLNTREKEWLLDRLRKSAHGS